MKKLTFCLILLLLSSCEDTLIENPKSNLTENFYTNTKELETAVAAVYSPVREIMGGNYLSSISCKSDFITFCRGSWVPVSEFQGLDQTNRSRINNVWENFYQAIRNANLIIKNTTAGEEVKNRYLAEARFLRGLIYFQLVRNWGGVPIHTEENISNFDVARSSIQEVYGLITNDLEFAEQYLPDNAPVPGRASLWAAKTVLADVYFYQGLYEMASNKAKEVINSEKYSLVEVSNSSNFEKIYGPEVINTTEEILYFKFNETHTWSYPRFLHGVGTPYLGLNGYYVQHTKSDHPLIKGWDNNDLRKEYNWYEWETPLGDLLLNKKWNDPNTQNIRNDYPLYRYADLLLIYAEASARAAGNPTTDGMEKLNMVHRRAYGYNPLQESPVDFQLTDYNLEAFIDLVIKERGYETMMEAKRWLDLKRVGEAKEYINRATGKNVADKSLLWPIPSTEIANNDSIETSDQNPGY